MNEMIDMINNAMRMGTSLMIGYVDKCAVIHHRIFPIEIDNDEAQKFISIKGKSLNKKEMFNFSYADAKIDADGDKRAVNINFDDGRILAIYDPGAAKVA